MNRTEIKRTLLKALKASGKLLQDSILTRRIVAKKSELSLVTQTDRESEKLIKQIISRDFPGHSFLMEESGKIGESGSRWIIDPLDGTTNFVHTYPMACVSIAYEEKGVVEAGGVLDPFRRELFFAARGEGATVNGNPITVSHNPTLADSLLATGFPYDRRERAEEYLSMFKAFLMKVQGIRRTGAAAMDLCYVACGRFDGFWELQLNPWDKAAALLIIEEAGGSLSNFSGRPLTLDDVQNVASNGFLHREMLEVLRPFQQMGK